MSDKKGSKKSSKKAALNREEPKDQYDEVSEVTQGHTSKQQTSTKEPEITENKKVSKRKQTEDANKAAKSSKTAKLEDIKLNKTDSSYDSLDFTSSATAKNGKKWNLKISTWNVSGLRALIKKKGLEFLKHEDPDIFCMQEVKCSTKKLPPEAIVDGYHKFWLPADKEGYSGTALFSKQKPLNVTYGLNNKEYDTEGRVITAEYEKYFLVTTYVPNAGRGLVTLPKRMKWDPVLRNYLKDLDTRKPVILCGDLNVAHEEIDLANPKTNTKSAGFTQEERDGMTSLLKQGFVDSFRLMYPDKTGAYTFWSYMGNARARNTGWRLDYFILSERLKENLCDIIIRSDVYGSDHCPVTLLLNV
uniref:DNA-(apurinic or apyrimidinic site) endonuclease n=1 Tax=Timema californicum TaxID=61474 RepID=A0A7R9PD18_TIMCA|nr:unnamed protein product [Timema californicum]